MSERYVTDMHKDVRGHRKKWTSTYFLLMWQQMPLQDLTPFQYPHPSAPSRFPLKTALSDTVSTSIGKSVDLWLGNYSHPPLPTLPPIQVEICLQLLTDCSVNESNIQQVKPIQNFQYETSQSFSWLVVNANINISKLQKIANTWKYRLDNVFNTTNHHW